jgi:hypothetical protein
MKSFDVPRPGTGRELPAAVLRAPDSVQGLLLAANVSESITVPSGAKYARFKWSTSNIYVNYVRTGEDTDLVTNGAFASDTSWTKGTGWTIAAGVATSDASQAAASFLTQDGTGGNAPTEGKAYRTTFTVTSFTAGNVRVGVGGTAGTNRASAATFTETIIAGSTDAIALEGDADFSGSVDNFSVVPVAVVPGDETTGNASEMDPDIRFIEGVATLNIVSPGTPIVTVSFYGE